MIVELENLSKKYGENLILDNLLLALIVKQYMA